MIVDDQIYHAEALKVLFDAMNVKSDTALSGMQAIRMIQERFEKIESDPSVE